MVSAQSSLFAVLTCFQRISTVLTWILLLTQVDAQNRSSEVGILLRFKTEMDLVEPPSSGDNRDLTNYGGYWSTWNDTDYSPCAWQGVICNKATSMVERLDLSGWGLQYLVKSWESLSGLRELRELDLSSNDFGALSISFIPHDFQTLTQLTSLYLSSNSFQGEIPPSISTCRNLQHISLQQNQLSGEIPSLGGLVDLQVLLLADNQLTGQFPPELGQITSLLTIDLSDNMLNGTIPSLSNLTKLLHLKLDNNYFAKFDGPLFPGAKSLEHLSASGNQLEGMIPSGIMKLPNLKVLNISSNRLSGDMPSEVNFRPDEYLLPKSFTLDYSNNQLTGTISPNLLQLAYVTSVNCHTISLLVESRSMNPTR